MEDYETMGDTYKSRVYTDRPAYADFDEPRKFLAIQRIIAKRLKEHPKAICSYSGGSDSDILLDLIERTREMFQLPPVKYAKSPSVENSDKLYEAIYAAKRKGS